MIGVIDTDVMIDFQRGNRAAIEWFESLDTLPLLPGLVAMELFQGARNSMELAIAEKLTEPFTIVWPTPHDCQLALLHFKTFHLSHSLGLIDSLISSVCLGLNATLLTLNHKHFLSIPGLKISQPYLK